VPFPADRQAIDIGDYYSDFSKIGRALGWEPRVGLQEGLARTVDYYARHHAHYWNSGA
jgi:UDP-glucose 4-epimerase